MINFFLKKKKADSLFLSNDEFSYNSKGDLMSATLRSSFSMMSPLTLTDKNRSSFSYTQKLLNGKLHSTFSNNNSRHGENSKSRASISDQKKSSSNNSKSIGSKSNKSHRSISDSDDNEDSIISNNKYYQIFRDKNPIPKLLQQMKVHFRLTKPAKNFGRNLGLIKKF